MPKDNIERAIKRGTGEGKDGVALEEVMYEGYGPHGIAILIDCVTDNRNRSVAEIKYILSRAGGAMSEAGSVSWQFKRTAYFSFPSENVDTDKIFELAVDAGADDVTFDEDAVEIVGPVNSFNNISTSLKKAGITPEEAGLKMVPTNEIELSPADTMQVMRVIENLEELDDVQEVYSNLSISEEVLAQLEEE
jgi:YebC/PmpR family DNA-binding regulatory protein